ncbi:hypothetical protein DFH07DRAFT_966978 [Mycena maculata]|uniref:Uncharacterized protein n=1 Tax=Mycena maculata TaxID=230809 RepID=A0AAD7I6A0_9AGAR|nr:hypothetical protein DFH07DRAFT_966978 [Mycena maculata]
MSSRPMDPLLNLQSARRRCAGITKYHVGLTVVVAGVEEVRGPISPTRGVTAARGRRRAQGCGLRGRMTPAEAGAHARPLMRPRRCWGSELGLGSSRGRASDGWGSVAGAGGECCRRRSIGQRLPKQPYLKQTRARSCTSHGRGGHDEDEGNIRIDPEKQDTHHIRATRRPECLRVIEVCTPPPLALNYWSPPPPQALFAKAASPARGTTERAEIYKHEAYVKADKLDLGRHDKYSVN